MNVAYVTVQFPAPSETFATNEVRVLTASGVTITVHSLRRAHEQSAPLLRDRGLQHLRITHNDAMATMRGLAAATVRPVLLLRLLSWIVRANRSNWRDALFSLLLVPRAFDILAELERDTPEVVHLFWGHFPTLVGFLVQQRLPDVVVSLSLIAYDLQRQYGGTVDVARRADVVRTLAQVNKQHIERFTGVTEDRIRVIHDGVDVPWLERICVGREKVPRRLVAVGRLVPGKGMDDVLQAFAEVRSQWKDATLSLLGDGPERPRLEGLVRLLRLDDAVQFLGHVSHEQVIGEMAKAEVFLLLSRATGERLPNVVKEAMACQCVCITTSTPGIAELVDHEVTGFVVGESEPKAAASIIDLVFSGQVDVPRMTSEAQAVVIRDFDVNTTAPRYKTYWRDAMDQRVDVSLGQGSTSASGS